MEDHLSNALHIHPAQKVRIASIQRELDAIWDDAHKELSGDEIVTRASMSNLLVYCDDDEQAAEVQISIPRIVQSHPSRVLILTGKGSTSEPGIEVFVSGHYRHLTGGWQVSAEQIRVVADGSADKRLPSIARAQLIGDLPTTLWWASRRPPPSAGQLFFQLATLSNQIIYDSVAWINPTKGVQAMSQWVNAQRDEYVVINLAWRRLKPWRSLISQVLSPAVEPGALAHVSRLSIEHGPHALASIYLMLGWLGSRLEWQVKSGKVLPGKQVEFELRSGNRAVSVRIRRLDSGPCGPIRLEWYWQSDGGEQRAVIADLGDERLGIVEEESDVAVRIVSTPRNDRSTLVAAQMAHRTRDKVFEQSLDKANVLMNVLNRHS